ncbi:MAG: hypothetical protein ACLPT6_04880 [Desulfobaccales bacterium]
MPHNPLYDRGVAGVPLWYCFWEPEIYEIGGGGLDLDGAVEAALVWTA